MSRKTYTPILDARPGDFIEWTWDDAYHDVWRFAGEEAAGACDFANATTLFVPVHHSYELPTGTATDGRALYQIPAAAAGTTISFGCSIQDHCNNGQLLSVTVGGPAGPDPSLKAGICAEGFELCPDQSVQGKTTSTFETRSNLPSYLEPRAAEGLRMGGTVTRAATPWAQWDTRRVENHTCLQRNENQNYITTIPSWEWPNSTLREVVEACSSNFPDACNGIAWKRRSADQALDDVYTGRHDFRRCLVTDGYTRLIHMGSSMGNHSVTKACPGCYHCRELANPIKTFANEGVWDTIGFDFSFDTPAPAVNTQVTVSLSEPKKSRGPGNKWGRWFSWWKNTARHGEYTAEIICRVDLAVLLQQPMAPVLEPDPAWVTFLTPAETGAAFEANQKGLQPKELFAFAATPPTQDTLNVLYPPGEQIDARPTGLPFNISVPGAKELENLTTPTIPWVLPAQHQPLPNGIAWPPVTTIRATFMPRVPSDPGYRLNFKRTATPEIRTAENVTALVQKVLTAYYLLLTVY